MEWERTGRGAGAGETRRSVVVVLGLRDLLNVQVEVSGSQWIVRGEIGQSSPSPFVPYPSWHLLALPVSEVREGGLDPS